MEHSMLVNHRFLPLLPTVQWLYYLLYMLFGTGTFPAGFEHHHIYYHLVEIMLQTIQAKFIV